MFYKCPNININVAGVNKTGQYLCLLKDKNKLDNQVRTIEISKNKKSDLLEIPLLGTIAAGKPIEAIEDKKTIEIPKSQLSKSCEHFALKVRGDSMIDEGIFDGDTVVIRKQPTAENGETVVALSKRQRSDIKKIYREKNGFRLQPANPNIKPIFTKELVVQGKVVSIIRNFEELKERVAPSKNVKVEEKNSSKEQELKKYLNKVFLGDIIDRFKK
ncbi:MAG: transcriptional repressor LexA [Patescibacteria group bacterium]|nr:transcriptional repressor LexA [Patescibacteria group bacterium]